MYYSVLYMKNGEIHIKPHTTREEAEATIREVMETKWGPKIDRCKVYRGGDRLTIPVLKSK